MKESGLITAICHYLQYLENQNKLIYIRNNSGAFINPRGGFYRMGKRGSADIMVFMPKGITLHLEAKVGKNKQNLSQLEMEIKLKQLGHLYFIIFSVDEVEKIIKRYL